MKKQWKETGWNGIHLKVPSQWEPGEIGRNYLLFENDGVPVLELKWGKIKGRFHPGPVMRKLAPARGRRQSGAFGQWAPPGAWQNALANFTVHGFAWNNSAIAAKGLLLYCPHCKTAALIQFFQPIDSAASDKTLPVRILDSFRDHGREGWCLWALYDIRAQVPEAFDLTDFHFRTGQFMLNFKRGKQWLCLKRWSPAGILLNRRSLSAFAVENMAAPQGGHEINRQERDHVVEGSISPSPATAADWRWIRGLWKGKRYQLWRVWRLPEHNRILAVALEDVQPVDNKFFDQIASAYGIIR